MRAPSAFVVLALVIGAAAGCADNYSGADITGPGVVIRGSGRFVTESRVVRDFTSVSIAAGARAIITQGSVESLEITAEDNILPLIESTVINGTLTLRMNATGSVSSRGAVYHIGIRNVRRLTATAGSTIEVTGIDVANLAVSVSAGSTFVASGAAARLDADASAGSGIDAAELRVRDANAAVMAGSHALLRVSGLLVASASASSTIGYFGDPEVRAQTSAASVVRRIGP